MKFFVKGTITEAPLVRHFKNGTPNVLVTVKEVIEGKQATTYEHHIDFNGSFTNEVSNEIDYVGAEVVITGVVVASRTANGGSFENLRGQSLILLSLPKFADIKDGDSEEKVEVDDDDLPF